MNDICKKLLRGKKRVYNDFREANPDHANFVGQGLKDEFVKSVSKKLRNLKYILLNCLYSVVSFG